MIATIRLVNTSVSSHDYHFAAVVMARILASMLIASGMQHSIVNHSSLGLIPLLAASL